VFFTSLDKSFMPTEIPKAYDPKTVEQGLYKAWEESGYFNPDKLPGKRREAYSIAMPPFNVTGILHIGHAVLLALQDIMIRFERMRGKKTLWLPGTDHAAIATQNVVEQELKEEGKTKYDLGREQFLERVTRFADSQHGRIVEQISRMGASCDWSRERFTLDAGLSTAVTSAFTTLYSDGLIYRGDRIVNWCPRCQSTLADDEVEYKEKKTPFYYFKYGPVVIGTARPETKFGDKVIVVHPDDKRYAKLVGTSFEVEWILGPITARVIADPVVDPELGTGAMTITPGHSFEDFALAQKYGLPIEKIIDENGRLTEAAGPMKGLPVKEARKKVVEILESKGLVDHIDENYIHNLSVCYRCGTPIEPLVSRQWFLAVDKPAKRLGNKTLKQRALEVVENNEIAFVPDRFTKVYRHWMENLHDWCISRQIWYGHKIPVWYCETCHADQKKYQAGKYYWLPEKNTPTACPRCHGQDIHQDHDTLDTWFSSGLWTFSTLGWPMVKDMGFDPALVDLVISGKKTKTFRLRDHDLSVGETCLTHDSKTKKKFGYLRILRSTKIPFNEIALQTAGHEPYKSQAELKTTFQKYYPDITITPDTPVWVYEYIYQKESDLEQFHPTSILETAYDIIFFWVARMILMSTYLVGEIPFKTVYLHGLVRDKKGRKMSKSLGNGIDPLEMADKYGADAVRLALVIGTTPGNDQKLDEQKIAGFRNYVNKVWNIGRFIAMQGEGKSLSEAKPETMADYWIFSRLNTIIQEISNHLVKYEFSQAGEKIYDFAWHEFADWYLEITKLEGNVALAHQVFGEILKLLHPYMPFVTEALWRQLGYGKDLLMIEIWPSSDPSKINPAAEKKFAELQQTITEYRRQRKESGAPAGQVMSVPVPTGLAGELKPIIERLAKVTFTT